MTTEDLIIKAMARAICKTEGKDPDYVAPDCIHGDTIVPNDKPLWKIWEPEARQLRAAYKVMKAIEGS